MNHLSEQTEFVIHSKELTTCIYILSPAQVMAHLRAFQPPRACTSLKLNYLVIVTCLDTVKQLHRLLFAQHAAKAQAYSVTITPFATKNSAIEHVKSIERICSDLFEQKYLEMMEEVQSVIERELVAEVCQVQFSWTHTKVDAVISRAQSGNFNGMQSLLQKIQASESLSQKQAAKMEQIKEFIMNVAGSTD